MKTLNLVLAVVFAAAVTVAGAVVFLMSARALSPGSLALSDWFRTQFQDLHGLTGYGRGAAIGAGLAAAIAGVSILSLEPLSSLRWDRRLHMTDLKGYRITVMPESIQQIVQDAANRLESVRSVR